ncbi:hypothetical protein [Streptomyces sp. Caat 7-52]|uniref:hypothetical protein n=1 Tax=Streptomyces sp. Caat 7-52 TaxID=2949637 RepID=UPI0020365A81|nr:hypothetical protein [Streptomyces sp. Caat 7-52]
MDFLVRQAARDEYGRLGETTAQAFLGDGLLAFDEDGWYLGELRDMAKRAAAAEVLVAVRDDTLLGGATSPCTPPTASANVSLRARSGAGPESPFGPPRPHAAHLRVDPLRPKRHNIWG